jgi:hypothetical protein
VIVTNGSQDAFTRAIEMLADPGDALLVEDPTYAGLIAFAVWAVPGWWRKPLACLYFPTNCFSFRWQ